MATLNDFHKLLNLIEEVKTDIKDNDYKQMVDLLLALEKAHVLLMKENRETIKEQTRKNEIQKRRYDYLQTCFCRLSIEHYKLNQICHNSLEFY